MSRLRSRPFRPGLPCVAHPAIFSAVALRILHIDAGLAWRGGQRQVLLLARGLRLRGQEPLVIAQPDSPLAHRLRAGGIAASTVRMRADWDLAAARRVRSLVRTWRADIVHAHDARGHAIAMAALVGKPEIPLLVTRRVSFVPRGRVKYGTRVARFIAISGAVRDALERGGVPRNRIDIVYSGVPSPVVARRRDWRAECHWPADSIICGVVGAMTAEKGVALLASIAERLPDEMRARVRLVLLGGSSAGRENIGGVEAFRAGFVDEIQNAMGGLDMLWHPSIAEGLGTAVIDAMALGVPPVAFSVGGLPELIVDGISGLLVPAADVGAFAAGVARIATDADLRGCLAAEGPERAGLFSVDRMVEGSQAVYARVLSQQLADRA